MIDVDKNEQFVCEQRTDEGLRTFKDGAIGTIRTIDSGGDKRVIDVVENNDYRIRKLTPRECWRLMGFTDTDFDRAKWLTEEETKQFLVEHPKHKGKRQFTEQERIERMSDTQLYKQAGNSIVVDTLYYIFLELYKAMPYLFDDLQVGSYFSGIGAFESALDRLYNGINQTIKPDISGGREITVYDDYNSNVRADQETIGTLTLNIGNSCFRNAYKLIEGG